MKQFFLAVGLAVLTSSAVDAQTKSKKVTSTGKAAVTKPMAPILKNSIDSFSYALGMNIANNLKQQGIEKISNAALQKALDDIFGKRKSLLDEQQANMCIQQQLQVNMSKKNEVVRSKGNAFLEANKKRAGVITTASGLQYEVIMKGDASSATPKIQDTVIAHYKGTLIDGKPFDNSYDRGEPLTIAVGGVIRGWTEVLQLMHIGDKFKVFIPSELGYGDRGAGADIPGGSALIFDMELLGIKPGAADPAK
ncbi:MAG: FKBP-type peptidyl-prolyl cis-trans isomerase [Bacteroidota bacterium]|nr:FKBP-type peptidyl-prolyl cis-trans isomerase [Ferruginibacter sp.]